MRKFILVVLILLLALPGCERKRFPNEKPNILLLVLDTLRADHLSGYGYERDTSPVLDRFAKENRKFDYAVTAAPWTPASLASIMTGQYVSSHGMMPLNDRDMSKAASSVLNPNLETLAEVLKKNGYRTGGITSNPWTGDEFGFEQGFEDYRFRDRAIAAEVNKEGMEIISSFKGGKDPFFVYMHFIDPHDPYRPPDEYAELYKGNLKKRSYDDKMQQFINRYDGEIKYLDTELGKFFSWLKEQSLYENTMIIIVADHGEQFMEHGNHRHGFKLFNDEVHVPLLIKSDERGESGTEISDTVSTIDIFPTIMDRIGLPTPTLYQGVSLLAEDALSNRAGVFSEIRRHFNLKAVVSVDGQKLMLKAPLPARDSIGPDLSKEWKDIETVGVFDRFADYAEVKPLENTALTASMQTLFDSVYQAARRVKTDSAPAQNKEISDSTLEKLKSLGYLQ